MEPKQQLPCTQQPYQLLPGYSLEIIERLQTSGSNRQLRSLGWAKARPLTKR